MERDRLKKKLKRQAARNTVFVLLGVIAIGALLFFYGQQLLINFSLLLANNNSDTVNATSEQDLSYIAPPYLDPAEEATNSARINVTGSTTVDKATIKLYVNDVLADQTKPNSKNEFRFKNIELEKGSNKLKAKTVTEQGKESGFSDEITITYSDKAPELTIEYPQDGQTLKSNEQKITGKTESGATVTVNGFRAIVEPNGAFSYNIKLSDGDNTLKFVTTDSAGNKTEKEIKVKFAP